MTHRAWSHSPLAELPADELELVLTHVRRVSPDDTSMALAITNELAARRPGSRHGAPRAAGTAGTGHAEAAWQLPHTSIPVLSLSLLSAADMVRAARPDAPPRR